MTTATTTKTKAKPALKASGGKTRLLKELIPRLPETFNDYHEICLGSGALFFALYQKLEARGAAAYLSDLNLNLITTYKEISKMSDEFRGKLESFAEHHKADPVGYFNEIRAYDRDSHWSDASDATIASWYLYLNKVVHSGMHRVNSDGFFNVPLAKDGPKGNKYPRKEFKWQPENLELVSQALRGKVYLESVSCFDALENAKPGDFVFIDPPYADKAGDCFVEYLASGFTFDDQRLLRDAYAAAAKRGVWLMMSNHADCAELYSDFNVEEVDGLRGMGYKGKAGMVTEIFVRNYGY